LFNNPVLSDFTLKQIHNGVMREYHARKAVLCMKPGFFMRAFTGNFKKATNSVMELHDDDPSHFEFALTFTYTEKYD
ncbi:hypothetical protein K458DRAFT_245924, partial [Lentithecium fluviatile CBS 122367]